MNSWVSSLYEWAQCDINSSMDLPKNVDISLLNQLSYRLFGSSLSLCSTCQNHTPPGPPGDSAATTPSSGAQSVGQIWGKNLNETPALGEMTYLHLQMCSPTSKRWPKFLDAQTRWLQVASYVSRGPGESTNVNNTLTAQPSDNLGRFPCLSPSICSLRFSYSPR